MATSPVASTGPAPAGRPEPIGEVTVLVFDWQPGKTEVQVVFPDEAKSGQAGAGKKQAEFRALILSEVDQALTALSGN